MMPANVTLGVCFSVGRSGFNKNYKPEKFAIELSESHMRSDISIV